MIRLWHRTQSDQNMVYANFGVLSANSLGSRFVYRGPAIGNREREWKRWWCALGKGFFWPHLTHPYDRQVSLSLFLVPYSISLYTPSSFHLIWRHPSSPLTEAFPYVLCEIYLFSFLFPLLIYVEGALYLALMSPCPISLLSWVHHLSFLTQEDPVGPDSMRFESSIKPQTAVSSLLPSRNGYIHALYDSGNHNSEMMSSFFVCVCVCCEMFFSGAPL